MKFWLRRPCGRATNLPHDSSAGTHPSLFLGNPEQLAGVGNFAGDDFFSALLIGNGKCYLNSVIGRGLFGEVNKFHIESFLLLCWHDFSPFFGLGCALFGPASDLGFGFEPIFDVVAVFATACFVQLVRATPDFFFCVALRRRAAGFGGGLHGFLLASFWGWRPEWEGAGEFWRLNFPKLTPDREFVQCRILVHVTDQQRLARTHITH